MLVRAENPFPFAWDLWSGITQEAQRWELYVWPGRVHDRAAWGGCGLWIENCCWGCCDVSLHPHKWIITWLPIFMSKEEEKKKRSVATTNPRRLSYWFIWNPLGETLFKTNIFVIQYIFFILTFYMLLSAAVCCGCLFWFFFVFFRVFFLWVPVS